MNDIHSKLSEDTNLLGHLNNITDQFKVIGDRNSSEQNQKNLVDSTTYQGSLMILFNELAQTYIFSTFYWIFQFLIPAIQILALMISPFISSIWETSNGTGKFIKILTCMISFSPNTYKDEFDIAGTVVISTIYVIIGIWFSILPLFYMKFKQYPKPILYISVLFYQIVVPMLILPFSANASLVFTLISDSITGASVFLVILIIIITALIIIGFIFLSSFTSFLISPSSSFTASYGGYHPTLVVVSSCVYIFLTKLAQLFEPWLEILIIVLHIGINAFFIYESFQFDFVKFGMNVYSSSYYSSIIIAHILNIIKIGGVNVPDLVRIIVPYSCFILFGIFYYFFFSKIESVALSILSVDDLHTDEMKKEYYDSLGIHSAQQFIRLCRIGMSNLPPLYIDWTFPVYSCEITSNEKLLLSTALFVSFFPAEQQAADYFIDRISKNIMTSFRDRFIMFRIKSIYAKRFASNSHISNKVYQQAKIESENTLIEIRDFWITISSSPEIIFLADLELLGSKLKKTKRNWKEALEQFPNDSRFPDGFSYFLLETMVDPENGVFMKLKSNHLMKGFAADLDKIYRAFAVARPMILKNKICDKKGNIKRNAFELTNGMTTTTISTTAVEKLADDIDSGILDKMIKELYLWPNIRKLLYNATSHYKPRLSTLGILFQLLGWAIFTAMAVILLVLVLPVFNNALEYFDRIQTCTILSNNIALGKVSLFVEWAYQIGIYYSDELYRDTLSEESRNEESSLRPELGRGQVVLTMSTIIDNYKALIVSFSHFMAESENSSHEASIFIERNTNRNICSDQGKIELEENISLKNAIAIILLTYYNLAFTDIDYTTFGSSQFFCQIDGTLRSILDSIDHGIADTRLSLLQELDANNSLFVIMMIVYVFIDLLIIIPLFHFSLFYYYYEAKRLFNALKELDVIESRKGSNLILLNSEGGDEEIVTNHSLNNFAEKNILFALLDILFSSFTFIAILVIFITSMSFNKSTVKFVDWSISGNKRLSIVYSALGQISEALVFKDSPPSFTNFSTSLNIGKQYAAELSDLHISFYGGEGGIKGKYKDLDHLHLSDQCVAPDITQTKHDYYHCLGLDQLLNYFMISIGAIDEKFSFNSEDYINIFHISVCELADRLYQSRMLVRDHMRAGISNQIIINVMMIMLCLVGIVALSITTFLNIQRFKTMIKAGLILIRRIPPPAIAGCESLKTFLSGPKQNSKEIKSASQIIFETLPTAVLDVASDETIEMMNEKAKLLFGFKEGQIIGQKLDCIIGKIENSEQNEEITEEAAGSIKLYSYFKEAGQITNTEDINGSNVKSSASFIVNCRCADDSILRCEAKLYPVSVYTGTNSNFIVYLHETSNDSEVQAKIKEAKDDVHRLLNQLVPSDVQGFIRGDRKDFSFVSKSATVIVIQTYGFFDNIKKFGHEVYLSKIFKLFQHFELGCLQFPPVMKYRQFSDMFIAIGGLFNKNDEPSMHTKAAISYAKQMISDIVDQHVHLDNNYENTNFDGHSDYNKSWGCDFAIQIGIATGGPLICGLNGIQNTSFDVAGSIIDDAILFAENSNVGRILLNEQAKDLSGELCEQGSMIERKLASFYLPDSIDAKSVLATQSSYRSNKKLSSKPITESMKTIAKLFKEVDAIPEDDGDLEEENNELSREMSHPIFDDETIE